VRNCIRQSSKSGGRTLAKEFVNNVIVALPLWKFDSASPALGGFSWNVRRSGEDPGR
jgi:hypothetical protein